MTDYAKWGRFVDDEDEDEEAQFSSPPRVTKLESGRSFKIGPQGAVLLDPSEALERAQIGSPAPVWDSSNGGVTAEYAWRQTRDEVVLQWFVSSPTVKAKDIALTYNEESRALRVTAADQELLCHTLPHDIEPNKGTDGEAPVDWELKRRSDGGDEQRFLELTLRKRAPAGLARVIVWWRSAVVGGPQIDLDSIVGRDSATAQSNLSAWEQAHAMFRSKMADGGGLREKITIDLSENDDEIGGADEREADPG